jgi:tetratricopeptide (TPR) repeat protein
VRAALVLASLLATAEAPPSNPYAIADVSLPACDALVARHPKSLEAWFCYMRASWKDGKLQSRMDALHHLQRIVRRAPEKYLAHYLLGVIASDDGQLDLAETHFLRAAVLAQADGHLHAEVWSRTAEVCILCGDGRFAAAAEQLTRATAAARQSEEPDLLTLSEVWSARCAWFQADYGPAIGIFETVRARIASGPRTWRTPWLLQLARSGLIDAFSAVGRHREAFELAQKLVAQLAPMPYSQAAARHAVAAEAMQLADAREMPREEADKLLHEALDEEVRVGVRLFLSGGELYTRLLLARRLGATEAGVAEAQKALAGGRREKDKVVIGEALRLLANFAVLRDPAHPQAALAFANEALKLSRDSALRLDEVRARVTLSWVLWRARQLPEAAAASAEAIDALDRLRARQPDLLVRARSAGELATSLRLIAGAPLEAAGDVAFAFQLMERLRARVLLDELLAARAIALPLPPPQPPPTLLELQQALAPGEVFLGYQVWGPSASSPLPEAIGSSWVLAVSKTSARAIRIPDEPALAAQIDLLGGLIERRDGSETPGAVRLHHDLLGEALAGLPAKSLRLIIAADGPLHRLPFGVLRESLQAKALAATAEISLVPSATLFLRWRRAQLPIAPRPLLAFADPDALQLASLLPLPYAREEVLAAARTLGKGSRVLLGGEASEHAVKEENLRSFGVVHFATHALVDDFRPERSALVLTPGAAGEDGLLQVHEVAALDLEGALVVLAACRSSSGTLLQGEGLLGLSRAFFQARARVVVGSLWPLRDDESASFFAEFYRQLAEEKPVAAALAAASRARIADGAPAAAWAGLVVLGDGARVPVAAPR